MTDPKLQTVTEYLFGPCSRGLLFEKAEDGPYWQKVDKFIRENADRAIGTLTFSQRDWLIKIKEGLLE